jgi:hypothetical protein
LADPLRFGLQRLIPAALGKQPNDQIQDARCIAADAPGPQGIDDVDRERIRQIVDALSARAMLTLAASRGDALTLEQVTGRCWWSLDAGISHGDLLSHGHPGGEVLSGSGK